MNIRSVVLIFKRELNSYFNSPIAYVVITMFLLITGYFFLYIFSKLLSNQFSGSEQPDGGEAVSAVKHNRDCR